MQKIRTTLLAAQANLRGAVAATTTLTAQSQIELDDILLTILFYRLTSAALQNSMPGPVLQYAPTQPTPCYLIDSNRIVFHDEWRYENCKWSKPQEAVQALHRSLQLWGKRMRKPMLRGLLRAERFSAQSHYGKVFSQSGVLAAVLQQIGALDFADEAPGARIGEIFSEAIQTLKAGVPFILPSAGELLLSLLKPSPLETVFDPACGSGELLLLAAKGMAHRVPHHPMLLYGQEADTHRWALAKMQLLCHGFLAHQLENNVALIKAMDGVQQYGLRMADVLVCHIPGLTGDANYTNYANTIAPDARRFHIPTPQKSPCIALVMHAIDCLRDSSSRMGLIMAADLLDGDEGLVLRRYLIEQGLLRAVIELPPGDTAPEVVLMIQQSRAFDRIAFIAMPPASPGQDKQALQYDNVVISNAWAAFHRHENDHCLYVLDQATLAQHQYQLKLRAYLK